MKTLCQAQQETALLATGLYEKEIRSKVELPENIGKIVVIDTQSGSFAVDAIGFASANQLRQNNADARLFALRIGYNVAASFGGVMERTTK